MIRLLYILQPLISFREVHNDLTSNPGMLVYRCFIFVVTNVDLHLVTILWTVKPVIYRMNVISIMFISER